MSTPLSLEKRKDLPLVSCSVLSHFYPKWERERERKAVPQGIPLLPFSPSKYIAMMLTRTQSEEHIQCYRTGGKALQCNGCSLNLGSSTLPSSAKTTLHTQRCKIVRVVNYQLWICELWLPHQPGKVDFKMHTDFPSYFNNSQFLTTTV